MSSSVKGYAQPWQPFFNHMKNIHNIQMGSTKFWVGLGCAALDSEQSYFDKQRA